MTLAKTSRRLDSSIPEVAVYSRGTNRFGIRNHIVILPTTLCTNRLAEEVAEHFREVRFGSCQENRVIALEHGVGCCSVGFDEDLGMRVLRHVAHSPNVGAVVAVSLGCGSYCSTCGTYKSGERGVYYGRAGRLFKAIQGPRRQFEVIAQGPGGTRAALKRTIQQVQMLIDELDVQPRVARRISKLVIGVMNGSSDPTSGLFANPAVGAVSDWLIRNGGRVLFSQTLETLGAESLLLERACRDGVRKRLQRLLTAVTMMRVAVESEGVESEPTQGNLRSGISTLQEKSVGTVFKIGHDVCHEIQGVIEHGNTLKKSEPGIYLVDGPGQDLICATGLSVAGAHLLLFTTGRGTPTGSALSPTIKITANRQTYDWLRDDIDHYLSVEEVFERQRSLNCLALESLVPLVLSVVEGRTLTSAEVRGQQDFHVRQLWPID